MHCLFYFIFLAVLLQTFSFCKVASKYRTAECQCTFMFSDFILKDGANCDNTYTFCVIANRKKKVYVVSQFTLKDVYLRHIHLATKDFLLIIFGIHNKRRRCLLSFFFLKDFFYLVRTKYAVWGRRGEEHQIRLLFYSGPAPPQPSPNPRTETCISFVMDIKHKNSKKANRTFLKTTKTKRAQSKNNKKNFYSTPPTPTEQKRVCPPSRNMFPR